MAFRFSFQQRGTLLVVVFEGEITAEEEQRALVDVARDPGFNPRARVLVDRRKGPLRVGPQDVDPQLELARQRYAETVADPDKPRMAMLVASDYDFGMSRMLELTAGAREGPHEIRVYRDLGEACAWLEVDPDAVVWP